MKHPHYLLVVTYDALVMMDNVNRLLKDGYSLVGPTEVVAVYKAGFVRGEDKLVQYTTTMIKVADENQD